MKNLDKVLSIITAGVVLLAVIAVIYVGLRQVSKQDRCKYEMDGVFVKTYTEYTCIYIEDGELKQEKL